MTDLPDELSFRKFFDTDNNQLFFIMEIWTITQWNQFTRSRPHFTNRGIRAVLQPNYKPQSWLGMDFTMLMIYQKSIFRPEPLFTLPGSIGKLFLSFSDEYKKSKPEQYKEDLYLLYSHQPLFISAYNWSGLRWSVPRNLRPRVFVSAFELNCSVKMVLSKSSAWI